MYSIGYTHQQQLFKLNRSLLTINYTEEFKYVTLSYFSVFNKVLYTRYLPYSWVSLATIASYLHTLDNYLLYNEHISGSNHTHALQKSMPTTGANPLWTRCKPTPQVHSYYQTSLKPHYSVSTLSEPFIRNFTLKFAVWEVWNFSTALCKHLESIVYPCLSQISTWYCN